MPKRACVRHPSGAFNPSAFGKRAESGTRTSSSTSSLVTEARKLHFSFVSGAEKPFAPFSTRKPSTIPASSFAHTPATSEIVPFVIHILRPLSTQPLPSLRARESIPPGLLPASGSVRPKQPIASPFASFGSQRFFCSSDPYSWIGYITSEPCTLAHERTPESP